jgi:hypothetical protein
MFFLETRGQSNRVPSSIDAETFDAEKRRKHQEKVRCPVLTVPSRYRPLVSVRYWFVPEPARMPFPVIFPLFASCCFLVSSTCFPYSLYLIHSRVRFDYPVGGSIGREDSGIDIAGARGNRGEDNAVVDAQKDRVLYFHPPPADGNLSGVKFAESLAIEETSERTKAPLPPTPIFMGLRRSCCIPPLTS